LLANMTESSISSFFLILISKSYISSSPNMIRD